MNYIVSNLYFYYCHNTTHQVKLEIFDFITCVAAYCVWRIMHTNEHAALVCVFCIDDVTEPSEM